GGQRGPRTARLPCPGPPAHRCRRATAAPVFRPRRAALEGAARRNPAGRAGRAFAGAIRGALFRQWPAFLPRPPAAWTIRLPEPRISLLGPAGDAVLPGAGGVRFPGRGAPGRLLV